MELRCHPITCKSALHKVKGAFPYHWDLNIYRGCEHGCKYCFAVYSHSYMPTASLNQDFFCDIYVKENIVDLLEQRLRSPRWQREVVNIGGVTDSYQSCEAQYQLMPDILRVMIRYKTPVIISSKSDLMLRDFDLIDQLSRVTYVGVAATVTTMDEEIRQKLEPGGKPSLARLRMLKEFRKTNASVGLHAMPITPFLTDGQEQLEALFAAAKDHRVHYLLTSGIHLKGQTKQVFYRFLLNEYPELLPKYQALYQTGRTDPGYKKELNAKLRYCRNKYQLYGNYNTIMKEKMPKQPPKEEQLTLF